MSYSIKQLFSSKFMANIFNLIKKIFVKNKVQSSSSNPVVFGNSAGAAKLDAFKESIVALQSQKVYSEPIKGLLNVLVEKGASSLERNDYLNSKGIRRISDIKEYTLDVILDYSLLLLEDDVLTEEEMNNIRLLKLFLGVEEGDFYRNGKQNEVKHILSEQLTKLYADNVIDAKEVLMKGDLQALFGLSYNEFDAIVHDIAKDAVARGADVRNLDTFI